MPGRPLRIAFVALAFPPAVGGSELYNAEYARRLHARGHALRLFTWTPAAGGPADASTDFEVRRDGAPPRRGALPTDALAAWLGEAPADVVLVARASRLLRHAVPVAARHAPVVLAVHELASKHTRRGPLGRWRVRRRYGLDRARRILVISEDTRQRVAALRPAAPVSLVPPGVDLAALAAAPMSRDDAREKLGLAGRRVLLTVSRLAANKGHARVLDVLPALRGRFPDLVYVVVGAGGERDALEAQAARLGVAEAVRFEGRVDDTAPYYRAADVFVMPSGRPGAGKAGEGFGISYVEAGACGVPVVASRSGGGAEIVVDGETGRVVDPGDAGALGSAVAELLADPARARRLGEAARRHCARFDWERGADALERVLRDVAGAA